MDFEKRGCGLRGFDIGLNFTSSPFFEKLDSHSLDGPFFQCPACLDVAIKFIRDFQSVFHGIQVAVFLYVGNTTLFETGEVQRAPGKVSEKLMELQLSRRSAELPGSPAAMMDSAAMVWS